MSYSGESRIALLICLTFGTVERMGSSCPRSLFKTMSGNPHVVSLAEWTSDLTTPNPPREQRGANPPAFLKTRLRTATLSQHLPYYFGQSSYRPAQLLVEGNRPHTHNGESVKNGQPSSASSLPCDHRESMAIFNLTCLKYLTFLQFFTFLQKFHQNCLLKTQEYSITENPSLPF